jgi:hypothetical protein
LGAAGLAAISSQATAEAKKKNKNKKRKKRNKSPEPSEQIDEGCQADLAACTSRAITCASQVEVCTIFVTAACGPGPECDGIRTCCQLLENCDPVGFLACLENAGAS